MKDNIDKEKKQHSEEKDILWKKVANEFLNPQQLVFLKSIDPSVNLEDDKIKTKEKEVEKELANPIKFIDNKNQDFYKKI